MKKKFRVKKNEEFQLIINTRKYHRSNAFVIYTKEKSKDYARIGISVPKKLGNAVMRNKTKRQVRSMLQELGINTINMDIIIIIRKSYFKNSYIDNRKDLEKVLKHVKI